MKVYVLLGLLFVLANADKKINLEDIERDNLRAENKGKLENDDGDEVKYSSKPPGNQQYYEQSTPKYSSVTGQPVTYSPPLQLQDAKYDAQSQEYKQSNGYSVNEYIYPEQNSVAPEQNIQPVQYYNSYRQQAELVSKKTPIPYHPQRFLYQPEVVVGNQIQSFRQKAATEKYSSSSKKGIFYVDVPMTSLLSYYPLEADTKTAAAQSSSLLQHLPTDAVQQISIPVYTQLENQKQYATSARNAPQTQLSYAPAYVPQLSAYYPKISKTVEASLAVKKPISPVLSATAYVQPETQSKKYLYTEAYLHPQTQYVQQLLYNPSAPFYTPSTSFYGDLYTQTPAYIQDNSLQSHANQYSSGPQQLHVSSTIVEQLAKQISHVPTQDYGKTPNEPSTHFVPPQYTPQEFKSTVTGLTSISGGNYAPASSYSGPRSLLDTYIPSKIIAAQDSERYRERPIQLESGFLPSKLNFVQTHKKRTAN